MLHLNQDTAYILKKFHNTPKDLTSGGYWWESINIEPVDFGYYRVYEEALEKALEIALNLIKN
jgi:hypothetical protein